MVSINNCSLNATNSLFPYMNKNFKDRDNSCSIDAITEEKTETDIRYKIFGAIEENEWIKKGLNKIGRDRITNEGYGDPNRCHPYDKNCDKKIDEKEIWISCFEKNPEKFLEDLLKDETFWKKVDQYEGPLSEKPELLTKIISFMRGRPELLGKLFAFLIGFGAKEISSFTEWDLTWNKHIIDRPKKLLDMVFDTILDSCRGKKDLNPIVAEATNKHLTRLLTRLEKESLSDYYLFDKVEKWQGKFLKALGTVMFLTLGKDSALSVYNRLGDEKKELDTFIPRISPIGINCLEIILKYKLEQDPNRVKELYDRLKTNLISNRVENAYKLEILRALSEIKTPEAKKTIALALEDPNIEIRTKAAERLIETGNTSPILPPFLEFKRHVFKNTPFEYSSNAFSAVNTALREDKNYKIRILAIKTLIQGGTTAAFAALDDAFSDPLYPLQDEIAAYLGESKRPEAIKILLKAFPSHKDSVRLAAIKALGNYIDSKDIVPTLQNALSRDSNIEIRAFAATLLLKRDPAVSINKKNVLLSFVLLKDKKWTELKLMGKAATPALLAACLKDNNPTVRLNAAKFIRSGKNRDQLPALLKALPRNHRAAEALGRMRIADLRAFLPLVNIQKKEGTPYIVRCAAIKALGNFGDKAIPTLVKILKKAWEMEEFQISAIEGLALIQDKKVFPIIKNALNNCSCKVRMAAALALLTRPDQIKTSKEIKALITHLKLGTTPAENWPKIPGLDESFIPGLSASLTPGVLSEEAEAAAKALAIIGTSKAHETLLNALVNQTQNPKIAALLEGTSHIELIPLLSKALYKNYYGETWRSLSRAVTGLVFRLTDENQLRNLLEDKNITIRGAAASRLLELGKAKNIKDELIIRAYVTINSRDKDKWDILTIAAPFSIPALIKALESSQNWDHQRFYAAEVLEKVDPNYKAPGNR